MNHHLIPAALILVGLAGTGVGLARQTHQQHRIDQDSRHVVADLAATRHLTASVVTELQSIHVMNQHLATINGSIAGVNRNLVGEADQMSAILKNQQSIWSTLAALNQGLVRTDGALHQNQSAVGQTQSAFQSPAGLVPVTERATQLVKALNQASATTAQLLHQMASKTALLGTLSHNLP